MDEMLMKSIAVDGFLKELGLKDEDETLVADNIVLKEIAPGTTLTHQGTTDVSKLKIKCRSTHTRYYQIKFFLLSIELSHNKNVRTNLIFSNKNNGKS
jgi:hypothetical protein